MSNVKFSYSADMRIVYGMLPDGTEFCIDADMLEVIKNTNFF